MRFILVCFLVLIYGASSHAQVVLTNVSQIGGVWHRAVLSDSAMPAQGGAAWFDYNNDGWYDLYLTGGEAPDVLYSNNGDGTFTDMSLIAGITILDNRQTNGVTSGDVNRDGWNDLFITTTKNFPNYLLLNNGDGTFSLASNWAGSEHAANSFSASFGDVDLDGWLDLYVCNWSRNMEVTTSGPIVSVDSESNYFYMNDGEGLLQSRAVELDIDDSLGCALGVMFTDYDNDNDQDIFVANDFGFFNGNSPNRMFRNNYPNLSFSEVSAGLGLDQEMNGMGVAKADLNEDGVLDYLVTNIRTDRLMISGFSGYDEEAVLRGIQNDSVWLQDLISRDWNVGWGAGFLDIDNDADEDLVVANGSLSYNFPHPTLDSNKLFLNDGHGGFTEASFASGFSDTYISRALAYCDYDLDGDLDVFVGITDSLTGVSTSFLYRNDTQVGDYLQVKATGVQNNPNGIGVKVLVYTDVLIQMREIGGESSFNSQHWQVAHFGVGGLHQIDSIQVVWPGGNSEWFYEIMTNQFIEVVEGQGILITGIDNVAENSVKTFPNPFSTSFSIHANDHGYYRLFDSKGNLVLSGNLKTGRTDVESNSIESGGYLLSVELSDGNIVTRKIIKQ